jgi:all-trans-retinol 13,14-reductase
VKRAVVIGSGMGGLTSALLLAQHGWAVTVLEQHYRAGGYLHRFFRNGVGYDTGFHYVGGARRDQLFGRAMQHLGVYDQLKWVALDPDGFDIIRYPDLELRVPVGVDRFRDRLVEHFPDERAGIDRYIALHRAAVRSYGWFNFDLSVPPESILPWEERTVTSVVRECFRDPRLRMIISGQAALYGVPPDDAPFGMHAVVTDHFLQSAWSIEGGGDRLALALVRKLRGLGGTLKLKTRATAVEVEGGSARAVITAAGDRYEADLVLANTHPKNVLSLLPEGAVRPAYASRVKDAVSGRAHFGLYLRVDGDLSRIGDRNLYRFRSWDETAVSRPAVPGDVPFYFLTCPGLRGAGTVPGAREVVLGLVQTDYRAYTDWVGVQPRPADYTTYKDALLASAVEAICEDHPGWRVTEAEGSTPLTTEHFTTTPEGAAYGHYHSVAQMGRYRLPMVTKVRGLVQVGQSVGFPGICGAMMSAYVVCGEILGNERLMAELRGT